MRPPRRDATHATRPIPTCVISSRVILRSVASLHARNSGEGAWSLFPAERPDQQRIKNLASVHAYLHTFANRRRGGIPSLRACTWGKWWAWEVLFYLIKYACIQGLSDTARYAFSVANICSSFVAVSYSQSVCRYLLQHLSIYSLCRSIYAFPASLDRGVIRSIDLPFPLPE